MFFLVHVYDCLKEYEVGSPEKYMNSLISSWKKGNLSTFTEALDTEVNEFKLSDYDPQGKTLEDGLKALLNRNDLSINIKSSTEEETIYVLSLDGVEKFEIRLDGSETTTKLMLLTYANWKLSSVKPLDENGLFYFTIYSPSNTIVTCNEKEIDVETALESDLCTNINNAQKYSSEVILKKYEIKNLVFDPVIEILDEYGDTLEYSQKDHIIKRELPFLNLKSYDEASYTIHEFPDVLSYGKMWSLYMTGDLEGNQNGWNTIKEYLAYDSPLYKRAKSWANSEELEFINDHTLLEEPFTDTKVSNFIMYSANLFSCDISLTKRMYIGKGEKRVHEDKMSERLTFVYHEKNKKWMLLELESITEKTKKKITTNKTTNKK